ESLKNKLGIDQPVDNEKINPSDCHLSIQTPSTKLVIVPKTFSFLQALKPTIPRIGPKSIN
ncbi:8947_t:CDS:1, partial [Paraglomus brasilianum]